MKSAQYWEGYTDGQNAEVEAHRGGWMFVGACAFVTGVFAGAALVAFFSA